MISFSFYVFQNSFTLLHVSYKYTSNTNGTKKQQHPLKYDKKYNKNLPFEVGISVINFSNTITNF